MNLISSSQEAGEEPSPALSKKASEVLEGMLMLLEYMFIKGIKLFI